MGKKCCLVSWIIITFSLNAVCQQYNFSAFPDKFIYSDERKDAFLRLLGDFPTPPPLSIDTLEVKELEYGHRLKIVYTAELPDTVFGTPLDRIEAYIFVPNQIESEKIPAVVAIHQDGNVSHIGKLEPAGLAGDDDMHYGMELFKRGYVVICPDRYQHSVRRRIQNSDTIAVDSDKEDAAADHWVGQLIMNGRTDRGKEAYDLMRAVDVLLEYDFVDKDKIGAIGHSGGGFSLVPFMFADKRVKVGVSSCGFFETLYWFHERAALKRSSHNALPGLMKYGIMTDYLAFIAPRPVLLTRGLWEWGREGERAEYSRLDVKEYQEIEKYVSQAYHSYDAEDAFEVIYFDEGGGQHSFPPEVKERAYSWLD